MTTLTRREIEVCRYVCRGWNNKQIGDVLGISHRTAEDHRYHIYVKFKVHNAVELIREVYQLPDEVPA